MWSRRPLREPGRLRRPLGEIPRRKVLTSWLVISFDDQRWSTSHRGCLRGCFLKCKISLRNVTTVKPRVTSAL